MLDCLRPSGSPLGVHRVVFAPKHWVTQTKTLLVRQTKDFFPSLAAVGGVSCFVLQLRDQ